MAGIDRWFIGGGAEHTPESARRLVYASTSGAEGVGGVGDLKVVPLSVPGQGVRVLTGSALIRSKYQGGETQTYMGTAYQEQQVVTVPTGSAPSSGRSDMIVMRVEDPFAAGSPWDEPSEGDIATADYVHIRVISGVPSTAVRMSDIPGHANDTAIPLARIDFPASTGTVTTAMIKDLRTLAQPRQWRETYAPTPTTLEQLTNTSTFVNYPVIASANVVVPEWATHVQMTITLIGIGPYTSQDTDGWLRAVFGDIIGASTTFDLNASTGWGGSRNTLTVQLAANVTALRGQTVVARSQGRANSIVPGRLFFDAGSQVVIDVQFQEKPL